MENKKDIVYYAYILYEDKCFFFPDKKKYMLWVLIRSALVRRF